MFDWFEYYKKQYNKNNKAMIYILRNARKNPFCNEKVIIKLCNWLDKKTVKTLKKNCKTYREYIILKARTSSYIDFVQITGGIL